MSGRVEYTRRVDLSALRRPPNVNEDELDDEKERRRLELIETEIYYSIENDDPDRLSQMLTPFELGGVGVDPNTIFSGVDPLGKSLFWSPLHFCCEKGRRRCTELLLAAGANRDVGDRWCMTPLMYAIQTEWFDLAEVMIDAGATIDWQDSRGRTPLTLAVECSEDIAVRMLCKAGADVNLQDLVGRSPAWLAVAKDGHVPHLKALLRTKQCELNCADLREKRTALQAAIVYAQNDRLEYVKMLLEAGSEVNHRDEANHNSMLNLLTKTKRLGRRTSFPALVNNTNTDPEDLEIAYLLIQSGYNLNDVPYRSSWYKFGGTAIKMAAENGATDIVRLFLEHGADPDIPDDCGVTPLLAAALNNHLSTCCVLVGSNCRYDITGDVKVNGVQRLLNPLQASILRGHYEIARLLITTGASITSEKDLFSIPDHLLDENGCSFWLWLIEWSKNPASLGDLCIYKLRTILRRPLDVKLAQLPLPAFVRCCVMMDHVIAEFV